MEEVLYWRKHHNLLEWFMESLFEVDNCKYHEVSKENFEKWLEAIDNGEIEYDDYRGDELSRDIETIKKILEETDFKTTKYFFYNWW